MDDRQRSLRSSWWIFLALPWLTWGAFYGIPIFESAKGFGGTDLTPRMMAVICICAGYAVLATIPFIRLRTEPGRWTKQGILCAFSAGACGLAGATFLSFAMASGDSRTLLYYVMPAVFTIAPMWNCIVAMLINGFADGHWQRPNLKFVIFLVAGALAAGVALANKPGAEAVGSVENWDWVLYTLGVVIFFGAFGPLNFRGIQKLDRSPMRALFCACLAYVVGGLCLIPVFLDPALITSQGLGYGLAAGASGFLGSFGVTMLNKTGMQMDPKRLPILNMPLVFIGSAFASVLGGLVWHPPEDWSFMTVYAPCFLLAAACMVGVLRNNPEFLAMQKRVAAGS